MMSEPRSHETGTRGALLDAAEIQFAESGFRASRLTEITERAGLTTGALYRYFDGKDGLLEALFELFDSELQHRIDTSRTVLDVVSAWLDLARARPGTIRAYEEANQLGSAMADAVFAARTRWAGALSAIVPGTATAGERRVYAELVCDMVEQYAHVERMGWIGHLPIAHVAQQISTLVEYGTSVR